MCEIKQSETKLFLLVCIVIIHTLFMICTILFIITYSFKKYHNKFIDFMALCITLSFIIYKKCILIDIYEYIKNLDHNNETYIIPDIAKDNYFRNKIKSFIGVEEDKNIDYTPYRLDILNNVKPMYDISNIKDENIILHQNMYNHKVHYLICNVIVIICVLHKYKLQKILPLFVIWILNVFKL